MLKSILSRRWRFHPPRYQRFYSSQANFQDDKLRILFCGSDEFSISSLEALHEYSLTTESNILSIDVATRQDKRTGRGLKKLTSPPIKEVANQWGLPVHQLDTFTRWQPPTYEGSPTSSINLVVAVSFGLLIPVRIINGSKYGGLNVHPSLLPDLRGAAPIEWSIINAYKNTGVSIQTLHPTKFDHGIVLSQSPEISIPEDVVFDDLSKQLANVGARMLVEAVRKRLFVPPFRSVKSSSLSTLNIAPKITPETRFFNWENDSAGTLLRKNRSIPRLYAFAQRIKDGKMQVIKILFGTDMRLARSDEIPDNVKSCIKVGIPFTLTRPNEKPSQRPGPLYVPLKSDEVVVVSNMLVSGDKMKPASQTAFSHGFLRHSLSTSQFDVYTFNGVLRAQDHRDIPMINPESTRESDDEHL